MAIPPPDPRQSPPNLPPLQGANAPDSPGIHEADAMEMLVRAEIMHSRTRRESLPEELRAQIRPLEQALDEIIPLALDYCNATISRDRLSDHSDSSSSGSEDAEVERQKDEVDVLIDKLEVNLEQKIQSMIGAFPDLVLSHDLFSPWWRLNRLEESTRSLNVEFIREQTLNHCVNHIHFQQQIQETVQTHKRRIFLEFCPERLRGIDPDEFVVTIYPVSSETHHGGKVSARVDFSFHDDVQFCVFLKPRSATIDSKVIDLFRRLNALPLEERSYPQRLPEYKILQIPAGGETWSVWEFIEGSSELGTSAEGIVTAIQGAERRDCVAKDLLRLEQVSRAIHLSDLHIENLIFIYDNPGVSSVVPIDLESIQIGSATGLYDQDMEVAGLSDAEMAIVMGFQLELRGVDYRLVPIPTGTFLGGISSCDNIQEISQRTAEGIAKFGFRPTVSKQALEKLILCDFLQNDIPYFTVREDVVYYGHSYGGRELGRQTHG